jgi:hypothetical protein
VSSPPGVCGTAKVFHAQAVEARSSRRKNNMAVGPVDSELFRPTYNYFIAPAGGLSWPVQTRGHVTMLAVALMRAARAPRLSGWVGRPTN